MRPLAFVSLLVIALTSVGCAGGAGGIDGTYMLTSRKLPDGTVVRPPAIQGCLSLVDGLRNFNVYWEEPSGAQVSLSSIAKYGLTDSEYWERNIYYEANGLGQGVQYDLSSDQASSPVTRTGNGIEFQLPLHDEPRVVFTPAGFTATRAGAFVDHWERTR